MIEVEEKPKPVRIQLRRSKGWRMPPNTIVVSRPSKWGNPFSVERFGRDLSVALYGRSIIGFWTPDGIPEALISEAYRLHTWLQAVRKSRGLDLFQLRGANLACWCGADQRCHADELLNLANEG